MCLTTQREGRIERIIYLIPLIATVSAAVVQDLRDWRIPNRLIAIGLMQGMIISAWMHGFGQGLLVSVSGSVIPVLILYVLFLTRALGAGDIKLFAVAGTFVGTDVVRVMIYSFLAGGVISLFFLLKEFLLSITNRKGLPEKKFDRRVMKKRVHFSVAIMCGVMCYVMICIWG